MPKDGETRRSARLSVRRTLWWQLRARLAEEPPGIQVAAVGRGISKWTRGEKVETQTVSREAPPNSKSRSASDAHADALRKSLSTKNKVKNTRVQVKFHVCELKSEHNFFRKVISTTVNTDPLPFKLSWSNLHIQPIRMSIFLGRTETSLVLKKPAIEPPTFSSFFWWNKKIRSTCGTPEAGFEKNRKMV
jgi:hypothetical protein